MLGVEISKDAKKFLQSISKKHSIQIAKRINALRERPNASDTKNLTGYPLKRADTGEYRVIYSVTQNTLRVYVIGKRNDSDVYRKLKRKW